MRPLLPLLLVLATSGARAQAPRDSVVRGYDDTRAQTLFGELMSPFCPGLTLATCPSEGADSLRNDIRRRLDLGQSPRVIREAYAAAWGEQILGTPPWRGWGVVLWLTPVAALLAGAAGLIAWLRRVRRRSLAEGAAEPLGFQAPAALGDAERRRLEEELAAFEDA